MAFKKKKKKTIKKDWINKKDWLYVGRWIYQYRINPFTGKKEERYKRILRDKKGVWYEEIVEGGKSRLEYSSFNYQF